MTVEASPNLIVPRVYLYTEHDPHAEERRALVAQYPGLKSCEAYPIKMLRAYVEQGTVTMLYGSDAELAAAARAKAAEHAATQAPASQPAPLPVNARPAPKVAKRDPAAEERREREQLAATTGLTDIERLAIMLPSTTLAIARHMASPEYRQFLRATAPAAAAKPSAESQREQARLDELFGLAEQTSQTSRVPQLPQPRTQAEAERAARLDKEFDIDGEGSAPPQSADPRVQTFGAPAPSARTRGAAPAPRPRAGDDSLERELAQFRASAEAPHPFS